MLVPIQSLFEARLHVSNLPRSLAFYSELLGLPVAAEFSLPGRFRHQFDFRSSPNDVPFHGFPEHRVADRMHEHPKSFGKSFSGLRGAVAKGWSLSSIMHYQSGSPFTATDTVALGASTAGITINRRANFVAGQPIRFSGTCANANAICWVNPNAFSPESPLGAGNAPASNIIGPAFYQWDLSLRKLFSFHHREGMALQFQADAFNAFNQTNWSALGGFSVNNVGSSSFGQITQSFPARVLQFGGKFTF